MANLRVIYNNVADNATLTASTTASGFAATNMQNSLKTSVHRSTGNSVTYTLIWGTAQSINCVALPATNLQSSATIQLKVYTLDTDVTALFDTGSLSAATGKTTLLQGNITQPTYVHFAYGGATKTSVWMASTYSVKKVEIIVTNSYAIDCARIIAGTYWECSRQASNGITIGINDNSEITTTRSGNTYVDRKAIFDNMSFELLYFGDTDRRNLLSIMKSWGTNGLVYICVFPDNTNPEVTQSYSIYGRLQSTSIEYKLYSLYGSNLTVDSW
jgi:hypothetical protein